MLDLIHLDVELFRSIHHALWGTPAISFLRVAQLVGEWGAAVLVAVVLAASAREKRLAVALRLGLALLVAAAVAEALKRGVAAPRPAMYVPEHLRDWSKSLPKNTRSWPSGHATTAFALATGILMLGTPARRRAPPRPRPSGYAAHVAVAFALAVSTALARVAVGAHWPSDVIAGAALGTGVAIVVARALDRPALNLEPAPSS